jgi:branched-chain amino acid transport system substrate-binding protein
MTLKRFFALTIAIFAATVSCERRPGTSSESSTGDIVVGMYGSLTGDGASFGQSSVQGAQLAVEDVNNSGGLLGGRKIHLIVEDDQSKPDEASNAVTKLITQDRVVAVLGEVASRRSLAAGPVCQKYRTPMISPASTNEKVTEIGDYIFRVCFIDPFQGEVQTRKM